ncbi:MAG: GGDEF domain-containing protein [Pseudomonadota bacterium]
MSESLTPRDTTKTSFLALSRMAELEIAPSPQNYSLWFEIESGTNPSLKREADLLLANGVESLDDARWTELFDRHIGTLDRQDRLNATEENLSEILTTLTSFMEDSALKAEGSSKAIDKIAGQMDGVDVVSDLRSLVSVLTRESRLMVDNNKALTQRLAETSKQVDVLKMDLRMAQEDALTDKLTGLHNRKCFDDMIQVAIAGIPDHGVPALLMLDVDHFKAFNDKFGHTVGDEVLKIVGKSLRHNVKGKDTAARYGGEEFAVILPGTKIDEAFNLGNQIRESVEGKRLRRRTTGEPLPVITISVGVSTFVDGETAADWIERTDAALYEAKRSGRNCVVTANDEMSGDMGNAA